jgi:peptide chain release factor 1
VETKAKMMTQLDKIEKRYQEIDEKLAQPEIATNVIQVQTLARERATLEETVKHYRRYKTAQKSLEDTRAMLNDKLDEEMAAL